MDNELFQKYGVTRNTMLDCAIKYAKSGLAVFPLKPQGKEPITLHGVEDATTDLETITDMWTKYPFANIGMACGSLSGGIIVVDVDIDDENGKDGNISIRKWEKDHGDLPDTAMTITGRGGNHYLYRYDGKTKNRVGCLPCVDVRADGGYIVLPPSIHPNGRQYMWEYDIDDYGIIDAEDSVIDLMNNGVEDGQLFTVPEVVPDGERNSTLYKLACSMQARGNSNEAIEAAVKAENNERCKPPLDDKEIESLLKSALSKKKGTSPFKDDNHGKNEFEPLETFTFSEIEKMDLRAPDFLIDDILPKGVCILGAQPKIGKSWMALDIAIQVASGGTFLGKKCRKAEVLYMALEDSYYRLRERVKKLQNEGPIPEGVHFTISSEIVKPNSTDDGLYKQIEVEINNHPGIELIIIDTLQMVTPSKQRGEDAYASTYTLLNSIRPFWQDRQIGFLLIHHTRKKNINDVDPFETFLGSQGLTGATDGMYIIQSRQNEDYCDFFGRGRDFEDVIYSIRRNDDTCRWENLGTRSDMDTQEKVNKYEHNPLVKAIRHIADENRQYDYAMVEYKELRETASMLSPGIQYEGSDGGKPLRSALEKMKGMLLARDDLILEFIGASTYNSKNGTYLKITKRKT